MSHKFDFKIMGLKKRRWITKTCLVTIMFFERKNMKFNLFLDTNGGYDFIIYRKRLYYFYDNLPITPNEIVEVTIRFNNNNTTTFVTTGKAADRIWGTLHRARYTNLGTVDRDNIFADKKILIKESGITYTTIYNLDVMTVTTLTGVSFKSFSKKQAILFDNFIREGQTVGIV